MGSIYAHGLAESHNDGQLSLENAILIHLTANHYPPVPPSMVPVCVSAVVLADCGDWDATVPLPEGVSWRGADNAPVHALVEAFHLEAFVSDEEVDDES